MGCKKCGDCCTDGTGRLLIGGSVESNRWLRHQLALSNPEQHWLSDECRFLLPPNKKGQRLCAIHNSSLRPAACRDYPNIPNAAIPENCGLPQGRKVSVRVIPASLPPTCPANV